MKNKIILAATFLIFFYGMFSKSSGYAGLRDGKLSECPDSPNCVSSQTAKKDHAVDPLSYNGSYSEAKQALLSIISLFAANKNNCRQ